MITKTITAEQVQKLAKLTRIAITPDTVPVLTERLSRLLSLIETMQAVDTNGVAPLVHPTTLMTDDLLRLREDVEGLEPSLSVDARVAHRAERMKNAPAAQDGYFLVPRVIE